MPEPTQKASPYPLNWQLFANEVKIYRDYACHDGKEGFSVNDSQALEKSDPVLFQETLQYYQQTGRLPYYTPYRDAPYTFFGYFGDSPGGMDAAVALGRALTDVLKVKSESEIRGIFGFRWAKGDASHGDDVVPYFGKMGWALKRAISKEGRDHLKASLLEYFKNHGVTLKDDELNVGTHRFIQRGYPFGLQIDFFPFLKCPSSSPVPGT